MEGSNWSEEAPPSRAMPHRRSRSSRRDRNRKAEDDVQQRLTGDAHWSKLLQVNASDDDMRLVRRLSSKRLKKEREKEKEKQRSREPSRDRSSGSGGGGCGGCGGGGGGDVAGGGGLGVCGGGGMCGGGSGFLNGSSSSSSGVGAAEGSCSVHVVNPRPRHGILSAVTSRIRQWLGSRRKYEISPRDASYLSTSPSTTDALVHHHHHHQNQQQQLGIGNPTKAIKELPSPITNTTTIITTAGINSGTSTINNKNSAAGAAAGAGTPHEIDAVLNRRCAGAGRLSPCLPQRGQPNGYAAAAAAETPGKIPLQRSPVTRRDKDSCSRTSALSVSPSPTTPSAKPVSVLAMLTQAIAASASSISNVSKLPYACSGSSSGSCIRSGEGGGGLGGTGTGSGGGAGGAAASGGGSGGGGGLLYKNKGRNRMAADIRIEVVDVSGHCPSPLSPSASRILASSRRHLLRQSRSKLKDRASLLVTTLLPTVSGLTHQPLTSTISCPPQAEAMCRVGLDGADLTLRRCHSWPLPRRKAIPEDDECPDSAKEEALQNAGLNGKESLDDCSIRFEDLELGECIKVGRRCRIYRARWHGDVFVHLFGELVKRPDREGFWRDVAKLCRIRHENINLFMGACTMAPNMAVITSSVTGKSLFEHIHVQREKMTLHTRVQILQGVAQGMGYLHAKGIVLRKLNTVNIFLCPRVKVSAIDFSLPEARYDRKDYACIPRGHLTYVAPELLTTLRVIPPRLIPVAAPSPETDVFAFGTIMYEVLGGAYPYPGFPPESIIWSVCSGHRQNLANINCTIPLKTLIEDCWSHEPLYRPDFPELSKELHKNSPQYKRHSSSEPERLNRSPGVLD